MFLTSIIDPFLTEKIVKVASVKKAVEAPVDLADQINDEAKGETPWEQAKLANENFLKKYTTIISLDRQTKRVLRRAFKLENSESKIMQRRAKRLLRMIKAEKFVIIAQGYEYMLGNPAAQIMAGVRKGVLDLDEVKPVWAYVVKKAGMNAGWAGCLIHFCYKYAELYAAGNVKKILPLEIAPEKIRATVSNKLLVPKKGETIEDWEKEKKKTDLVTVELDTKVTEADAWISSYKKDIASVDEKINKWKGSGGKNEEKIPKWLEQRKQLEDKLNELEGATKKNKESVEAVRTVPVTSVDYELEIRKVVQKAIEAHNAIFAKSALENVLNDLSKQLDNALKSIKTTSKQAGVLDKIISVITKVFDKLKQAVKFIVSKVKDYVSATNEFDALVNVDTSEVMANA